MSRVAGFMLLALCALYASHDMASADARIAGIIGACALAASLAGFAFSALAGGAFAYLQVDPVRAVHTLVVCSIAIQLYSVWKLRASIRWRPLLPMIAAGFVTVPIGVWVLRHVDSTAYAIGLGIFLCAYGSYAVLRRDGLVVRESTTVDVVAGALGGLTGGLAGLPGPAVTIWCSMRGWDKLEQRAVYQPFILVMQLVCIASLHWQGSTMAVAMHDLRFVPFAMIGAIAGFALYQRMTSKQFQAATNMLLVVSGLGLLMHAL